MSGEIHFLLNPRVSNAELNELFSVGWPYWQASPDQSDWQPVLRQSLAYVCAYASEPSPSQGEAG